MLGIGAVLAVVILVLRRQIPESPRWLGAKGRDSEANEVLGSISSSVAANEVAPAKNKAVVNIVPADDRRLPTLAGRVAFVCAFWFAWDVLYYGVSLFAPTIVKAAHGSTVLADLAGMSLSLVSILGTVICIYLLVDRFGRRPLLIFGFLGLSIPLFILALAGRHPAILLLVILLDLGVLIGNFGPGVLPWIYATDLFPTSFRAFGTGIGAFWGRVGGLLGVFLFPTLVTHLGISHATYLFVAAGLFGCIVGLIWAPETKGRSLESLESTLKK